MEGLLAFGIGGIVIVYIVAPLLDNKIKKISKKIIIPICIILLSIFVADMIYSKNVPNTGKGITEYSKLTIEQSVKI